MEALDLPAIEPRIRQGKGTRQEIWDACRKKYVALTPEEWVRQHFARYLILHKGVPESLMGIEISLKVNGMPRRCDILVWDHHGNPYMIVECKAPEVEISQEVFDQAARYNLSIGAPFLIVTNGRTHYVCQIDHQKQRWDFLQEIPDHPSLIR